MEATTRSIVLYIYVQPLRTFHTCPTQPQIELYMKPHRSDRTNCHDLVKRETARQSPKLRAYSSESNSTGEPALQYKCLNEVVFERFLEHVTLMRPQVQSEIVDQNPKPKTCLCQVYLKGMVKRAKMKLLEDLVEKIIAMMPFPCILKARTLSKSWKARFAPISSLHDDGDEKKRLRAISFQRQVSLWSPNWGTFFSNIFANQLSLASDWTCGKKSRLPSLTFLPNHLEVPTSNPEFEGPLLYGCVESTELIFVANVLTRTWKVLPPRPNTGGSICCWKKLVKENQSKTYKVVVFCRYPPILAPSMSPELSAHIYDSKTHSWTCKRFFVSRHFRTLSSPVFLDGVLYTVADNDPEILLAFNVEEETLKELSLTLTGRLRISGVYLVACNTSLLMIANETACGVHVLKIDLQAKKLLEVARGPPASFNLPCFRSRQAVSDGTSILFGIFGNGGFMQMVTYNVEKDNWTCSAFPYRISRAFKDMRNCDWTSSIAFQPGLSPFLEV